MPPPAGRRRCASASPDQDRRCRARSRRRRHASSPAPCGRSPQTDKAGSSSSAARWRWWFPSCRLLHVIEDSWHWIGLDGEPTHAIISPPPSQLAARVTAVGLRHRDRQLIERELASDVRESLGITDSRKHRPRLRHAGVERGLRLRDEATPHLLVAAFFEAAVDHLETGDQADPQRLPLRGSSPPPAAFPSPCHCGGVRRRRRRRGGPAASSTSIARMTRTGLRRSTPGSGSSASRRVARLATSRRESSSRSSLFGGTPVRLNPSHNTSMYSIVPPSTIG